MHYYADITKAQTEKYFSVFNLLNRQTDNLQTYAWRKKHLGWKTSLKKKKKQQPWLTHKTIANLAFTQLYAFDVQIF